MIQIVVLYPLTFIIDSTINIINGIYQECKKREHYITVIKKYKIIIS